MESKTIKISKENYRWLLRMAADIQKKHGKLVSFDETLNVLKEQKKNPVADLRFMFGKGKNIKKSIAQISKEIDEGEDD